MKLKRLSLFLALVMILSAFAGTFTFASAEVAEDLNGAWEVNGKTYATLNDALSARGSATTIYLIKDYAQSHAQVDINFAGSITIEGKGATEPVWSVAGTQRLLRVSSDKLNAPNVTIRNLKMDDSQGKAKSVVQINQGTLTLDNVDVVSHNTGSGAVLGCDMEIAINIINGSKITATGDAAKTGAPSVGAIYIRGSLLTLNIENSEIDASGYCAAIYNPANYGAAKSICLSNATIKATSGVTYAIFTNAISTLYKLGSTTITSGTTGETDAVEVLNAKEAKPDADTEEEADALAVARGFQFRNNASALAAIADANGDGFYYDGYLNGITAGELYLITDVKYNATFTLPAGNLILDGQNKYKFYQDTNASGRLFNTGAANSNTTFRNLELVGYAANGMVSTKYEGCTVTFDNVTAVYEGASNNGPILAEKANTTFNIINGSSFTMKARVGKYFCYNGAGNLTLNIVNSTVTRIATSGTSSAYQNVDGGLVHDNNKTYSLTVKNSTIDYSQCFYANTSTEEGSPANLYERIISNVKNAASCKVVLDNATLIKPAGGNAPIVWHGGSTTLHMYGTNSITGGDRMVEFAAGGVDSAWYLGGTVTPSINTEDGAGIRTVKDSSGIRFISTISADVMVGLEASLTGTKNKIYGYSFGTIVMKASDLEGTTVDAAIAAGKKYVDIKADKGIVENADGSVNLYAALVNIKEKNLGVEFAGIAYIDIVIAEAVADDPATDANEAKDAVVVRIYSDYNAEDNARSITEVAKRALADVKTTSSNELVDGFRYNNKLEVGETYYVDGEAKIVAEGETFFSPYNADQRATIAEYLD